MSDVRFFDYRPAIAPLRDALDAAYRRVLDSGVLVLGPEVEAFEREFAAWCGRAHGVGCNSGTDAIALALRAAGLEPCDEVLTVSNAGVPPVAGIRQAGGVPRFVEIDPRTQLVDPAALEAAVGPRTRAILAVHLYGRPIDLEALERISGRHGLALIEDCAQAHGARWDGRRAGSAGRIACFSFYPTKNLGALGDGGLCLTDDPALDAALRSLRFYGHDERRHARREGVNTRLDELQAAFLRVRLGVLDEAVAERRRLARSYLDAFEDLGWRPSAADALPPRGALGLPAVDGPVEHAFHLFPIRVAGRDRFRAALAAAGVASGIHYAEPVHTMEAYRAMGDDGPPVLPVTDASCASVVSLPLYEGLPDADLARVIDAVRDAA